MKRASGVVILCIVALGAGAYLALSHSGIVVSAPTGSKTLSAIEVPLANKVTLTTDSSVVKVGDLDLQNKHLRSITSFGLSNSSAPLSGSVFSIPNEFKRRALMGDELATLSIVNALSICLPDSAIKEVRAALATSGQGGQADSLPSCATLPDDFSRDKMYWLDLAAKQNGVNAMLKYGLTAAMELDPNSALNVADPSRASAVRQRAVEYLQQAALKGVAEAYPVLIRYYGTGLVAGQDNAQAYAYAVVYSRLDGQDAANIQSYYTAKINTAEGILGSQRANQLLNACCKAG